MLESRVDGKWLKRRARINAQVAEVLHDSGLPLLIGLHLLSGDAEVEVLEHVDSGGMEFVVEGLTAAMCGQRAICKVPERQYTTEVACKEEKRKYQKVGWVVNILDVGDGLM